MLLALFTAIVVATAAGWLTGFLVAKGRIAPFIATLGGLAAYRSIAMSVVDGATFDSASKDIMGRIGSGGMHLPGLYLSSGAPVRLSFAAIVFIIVAAVAFLGQQTNSSFEQVEFP